MIAKEDVVAVVEPLLHAPEEFLVEVKVSADNVIGVTIDHPNGVSIERCIEISRSITGTLDREVEDYSLEVSSASLTAPFVVAKQYLKHKGNPVRVVTRDGMRHDGIMSEVVYNSAADAVESISVEFEEKVPAPDGKGKKKVVQLTTTVIPFAEIKSAAYRFVK